jgi:exonuclease SbcC
MNTLEEEILTIEVRIKELKDTPADLKKSELEGQRIGVLLNEIEKAELQISEKVKLISAKESELSSLLAQAALIEPDISVEDSDYNRRVLELKAEKKLLVELYKTHDEEKKSIQKELDILNETVMNLTNEIDKIGKERERLSKRVETLNSKLLELNELKSSNEKRVAEIEIVREKLREIKDAIARVKDGHKLYLENIKVAEKEQQHRDSKEKVTANIEEIRLSINLLEEKINSVNLKELQDSLATLEKSILEKQEVKDSKNREIATIESEIKQIDSELERAKKAEDKAKRDLQQKALYEKKLKLTEKFRNSIKDMGRLVSSVMIENIAVDATNSYREITGGNDRIEWISDENNSYLVKLVSERNGGWVYRDFTELSGGEQVAVALALRTCLAQTLASGNFVIFDEPTINLDSEKKEALADSIRSMLKDIDQTIIVTHDDLFREMAQKVIEL